MAKETVQFEYELLDIVVDGDYTPEEPMVMYHSDMSGHPGSPAEFEIHKVYLLNDSDKQDLYPILSHEQEKEIEELAIRFLNK